MSVVRRGGAVAGAVLAGVLLLGGSAWAQEEDPCAPGADGSVPEMCQSGPTEPAPTEPGPTEPDATDPAACPAQPVEPGDGQVVDGGAGSEPSTGTAGDPGQTEPGAGEEQPAEPADEKPAEAPADEPATEPEAGSPDDPVEAPAQEQPSSEEPSVVCAYGIPGSAGGGAAESATGTRDSAGRAPTLTQLPRTGAHDRVVAAALLGSGLVLAGAGAAAAGRRRTTA